jgi:putative transposase
MPRRARLAVAWIPWHITHRGNNRSACFYAAQNYRYYLATLAEQTVKFDCQLHAYVLMTNHVHLLVTPGSKNSAALLMKNVAQRYTQYINCSYRRSGTLWEGRFKSCLTREDAYVLACYRYIELNPVRAGMVPHPAAYPWSSYGANGEGRPSQMITAHPHYLALGADTQQRLSVYRELLRQQLDAALTATIRSATNAGYVLGSDPFQREIADMLQRRVVAAKRGRPARQ